MLFEILKMLEDLDKPSSLWKNDNFISGIVGAAVGALIGGVISWWLQRQEFTRQHSLELERINYNNSAIISSVITKTQKILATYLNLTKMFKASLIEAQKDGKPEISSEYVKSLMNFPDRINYSTEELSLLSRVGLDKIYNTLFGVESMHNSIVDALHTYSTERFSIYEQTTVKEVGEGGRVKISISGDEKKFLAKKNNIDSIVVEIRNSCFSEFIKTYDVLISIIKSYNKDFGGRLELRMPLIDDMVKSLRVTSSPASASTAPM